MSAGYFIGRCIGVFLLPVLGTWIYYAARKLKPAFGHRLIVICGWTLAMVGLSIVAQAAVRQRAQRDFREELNRIERRASELAGKPAAPVAHSAVWDAPRRSFFADVIVFHDQYRGQAARVDSSELMKLYTPESFGSRAEMEKMIVQLQGRVSVDKQYASIRPLLGKMMSRMREIRATAEERRELAQGGLFDSATRVKLDLRDESIQDEGLWLQSAIELYQFVLANEKAYSIDGARMTFSSDALSKDFYGKLARSKELRAQMMKTMDEFAKAQAPDLNSLTLRPIEKGSDSAEIQAGS
jgi:hypothetical protein